MQDRLCTDEAGPPAVAELRPVGPLRPDNSPEHWYTWWPDWVDQSHDDTLVPVVDGPEAIPRRGHRRRLDPVRPAVCHGWGHLGGFANTLPLGGTS